MASDNNVEDIMEKLKMKIIIGGTKIEKNIVNLILKEKKYDFESIDNLTNNEFTISSFTKPKWDFYIFDEGFDEKKCNKLYEIIHKNFGKKNREIESTLIFFTEEDESDKFLLDFFDQKNSYFHPFIIFITSNKNKDKLYYENYIKENELDFDERNIEIINKDSPNIQELIFKKLWKTCCYYNEIGDNIIIPELEIIGPKKELNVKFNHCLNFFITGKPGAGKSTLVNVICNDKKAKEKIGGGGISNYIVKYFIGELPIALYDTPGFNSRNEIEYNMKRIKKKIKEIYDDKEQIHGIFYMINSNSSRTLDEGEIIFIKFILKYKIPIFFLLNFSKPKGEQKIKKNNYYESLFIILEKEYPGTDISKYIYPINLKNDYEGNTIFGLDKLFLDLYKFYSPHKIDLEQLNNNFNIDENYLKQILEHSILFKNILEVKDALKICHKKAKKFVKVFAITSFLAGATPIPLSDSITISSLELFLLSSILTIYGFKLNKIEMKSTIKSFSYSSFSALCGFIIGNILLLIPWVGTIIGSIIRGTVSSITTYTIGELCIKFCEENFKKENVSEFYYNLAINYNNAIDNLEKLGQNGGIYKIQEITNNN